MDGSLADGLQPGSGGVYGAIRTHSPPAVTGHLPIVLPARLEKKAPLATTNVRPTSNVCRVLCEQTVTNERTNERTNEWATLRCGEILVRAATPAAAASAKTRIDVLLDEVLTSQSLPYTHFLNIPLNLGSIPARGACFTFVLVITRSTYDALMIKLRCTRALHGRLSVARGLKHSQRLFVTV